MLIGKTQFNVDAVKSLTASTFVKLYKAEYKDKTEDLYYQITGFKKKQKKKSSED